MARRRRCSTGRGDYKGADVRSHGRAAPVRLGSRRIRPRPVGALHGVSGVGEGRRARRRSIDAGAAVAGHAHRRQRAGRIQSHRHGDHVQRSRRRRSIRCRRIRSSARRCSICGTTRIRCCSRRSASTRRATATGRTRRSTIRATKKLVQLADDSIPNVSVSDDGKVGVAQLARAVHDRADVGRRWHRRLRRSIRSPDARKLITREDQRQRAAFAGREVRHVLRQGALVHATTSPTSKTRRSHRRR